MLKSSQADDPVRSLLGRVGAMVDSLSLPLPAAIVDAGDENRARLRSIVGFRWVAIFGQLAVAPPALSLGWLGVEQLPAYLLVVAALFALNLFSARRLRRAGRAQPMEILAQLSADVGALTLLLCLSGGAWNPLSPVLFVHAGLAALLLQGRPSTLLLSAVLLSTALINLSPVLPPALSIPRTPAWILLPCQALIVLVLWWLTAWLGDSLAEHRRLLLNLKEQQQRADRLRAAGALAAGFSHQFATPLNTLRLRLDRLARRLEPAEADEDERRGDPDVEAALDAIERCESVLRRMVGKQLEPGAIRMEDVDVPGLVRQVSRSWASGGRSARVEGVGPNHRVTLPSLPFTQSLLNLLDNAAEAMDDGSAQPVEIEVGCSEGMLLVRVMDRGPGWPDLVRKNLGQPFVTTKENGNGLGLYNVHALAVALGGELRLEDRPGGGACACVALPCDLCGASP